MIIDLILDRRDGDNYSPKEFYFSVLEYGGHNAEDITRAMDSGSESDVKMALVWYLFDNGYNMDIANYIKSVNWL